MRPKALIFTRAWVGDGAGTGVSALMKRALLGPAPFLMSMAFIVVGILSDMLGDDDDGDEKCLVNELSRWLAVVDDS